jgi:uncharacterized protein
MSNVSSNQPVAPTTAKTAPASVYSWSVFSAIVIMLLCFILLPIIAEIIVSSIPSILGWDMARGEQWLRNSAFGNFFYVLLAELFTVGLLTWFVRSRKQSFLRAVALRKPQWKDLAYAAAGILIYFGLFIVALSVINALLPVDTNKEQAIGFQPGIGGVDLGLAFVSLVLLPPLAEEMVFRGFLFGTLRSHKVGMLPAVVITSVLFGMLHLFGSGDGSLLWVAFIDTFVLSVVLCYLREITGSIWASIAVHALKNGFVFVHLFIIGSR